MIHATDRARHRTWRHAAALALFALSLLSLLLLVGCADETGEADPSADESWGVQSVSYAPPFGSAGLNERLFDAVLIARVRLKETDASAEYLHTKKDGTSVYQGLVHFKFEVLEYLKGAGGNEVVAYSTVARRSEVIQEIMDKNARGEVIPWRLLEDPNPYSTMEDALAAAHKWEKERNTQWDDREAIVFLREEPVPGSSDGSKRYLIGSISEHAVDSRNRAWLPAQASAGASASSGEARYLLEPPGRASAGGAGAASSSGQPSTISAAELKAAMSKLDKWVKDGEGVEGYLECIWASFGEERWINGQREQGRSLRRTGYFSVGSGLPAGTSVREWAVNGRLWFEGEDKDLFLHDGSIPHNDGHIRTTRPLPGGRYTVYWDRQPPEFIPCSYYPEERRNTRRWFFHVTSTAGVVHEAFFDPVVVGAAVRADASNGVLKPAAFAVPNTGTTTIASIEWESQQVEVEVSPYALPASHHVDFISLDGTVALRLDVDDATETISGSQRTFSWRVCKQPWVSGDKLMLRLGASPSNLTGAANDPPCAAAASTSQ